MWHPSTWQAIYVIGDPVHYQGDNGTACLGGVATHDSVSFELLTETLHSEVESSDLIAWFYNNGDYAVYLATPAGLFLKEDAALEHRMVDLEDEYEDVDFIKIVPKAQVDLQFEVTYEKFAPTVIASPPYGSRLWAYEQRGWL
jgi:hypothetical protein